MSASDWLRTDGNSNPARVSAAWHGRALPDGEMLMKRWAQPPMQALGRVA